MAKHMSYEDGLNAADELLKMFAKIDRECLEREQDTMVSVNLETGEIIK